MRIVMKLMFYSVYFVLHTQQWKTPWNKWENEKKTLLKHHIDMANEHKFYNGFLQLINVNKCRGKTENLFMIIRDQTNNQQQQQQQ